MHPERTFPHISPQVPSAMLAKGLGLICIVPCHLIYFLQEAVVQAESQLDNLKARLERQESEPRKADSKFKFSLDETENLKTGLLQKGPPGPKKRLT